MGNGSRVDASRVVTLRHRVVLRVRRVALARLRLGNAHRRGGAVHGVPDVHVLHAEHEHADAQARLTQKAKQKRDAPRAARRSVSSISAPDDSRNGVRRSALRTSLKNVLPHHHVNSPLALPKSTSLSFRVMTPPSANTSTYSSSATPCRTARGSGSRCSRPRLARHGKASSSSLSELKVSPFSAGAASVAGPGFSVAAAVDFVILRRRRRARRVSGPASQPRARRSRPRRPYAPPFA